jgi:hypothetical protein
VKFGGVKNESVGA